MDYIRINENDNVIVALNDLKSGYEICVDDDKIVLNEDILKGHKIAIRDIKIGEQIIKYGLPIGHAIIDIKKGNHVHVENIKTNLSDEIEYCYNPSLNTLRSVKEMHFDGYRRKDGKVGIRNEICRQFRR